MNALFKAVFLFKTFRESSFFRQKFKQELIIKGNCETRKNLEKPRLSYAIKKEDEIEIFEELCNIIFEEEENASSPSEIQYLSEMIGRKEQELLTLKGSYHSHSLTRGTNTPSSLHSKHDESLEIIPEFQEISPIKRPKSRESQLNPIPEYNPLRTDSSDSAILSLLRKLEKC